MLAARFEPDLIANQSGLQSVTNVVTAEKLLLQAIETNGFNYDQASVS